MHNIYKWGFFLYRSIKFIGELNNVLLVTSSFLTNIILMIDFPNLKVGIFENKIGYWRLKLAIPRLEFPTIKFEFSKT